MYQRDVAAENKETLERLVMALDELTRVVSKDDTSRTILDVLKEKGAKDVKEIPASDGQAEEIKTRYRSGGGGGQAGGTRGAEFQDWNLTTLARLNQAFRALQGDLGAFQRTLVNAAHWGNQALNAGRVAESVASTVTEAAKPKPVYRKATDEEIEAAMKDAASKGMSGMEMLKVAEKLAKQGIEVTPEAGDVANQVAQNIKTTAGQTVTPQAAGKVSDIVNEISVEKTDGLVKTIKTVGGTLGFSTQTLAAAASSVALAAAPVVIAKFISSRALNQINELRPFQMLNSNIATSFAQYDVNRLMMNMRIGRGISASTASLLASQTEFDKTMEPIRVTGTNFTNSLITGGLNAVSNILTPINMLSDLISKNKRDQQVWDEALNAAGQGGVWGTLLGGIAGAFAGAPGGVLGMIVGAAKGAAWGGGIGAAGGFLMGGVGEIIGERRMKELASIAGDKNATWNRGMINNFVRDIQLRGITPPRAFIP